jgi:hypothetical protein
MAYSVKVQISSNGPIRDDFRTVTVPTLDRAYSEAIRLAAIDAAYWARTLRAFPADRIDAIQAATQNRDAMLCLIEELNYLRSQKNRWNTSATPIWSISVKRLAHATITRV